MNLYATIPLNKVVKAAATELEEPLSRVEERFSDFAVRGLRKINATHLRMNIRRVTLPVNPMGNYASLPCDFKTPYWIGFITNDHKKASISFNAGLYGPVQEVKEDCCKKCGAEKAICELMDVTTTTKTVVVPVPVTNTTYGSGSGSGGGGTIGGGVGDESGTITTTKRLLANGDYIEDKTFPVWDEETQSIDMEKTRTLVEVFDIADCGCLKNTHDNIQKLQSCCENVYNLYYAPTCDSSLPLKATFFPEDGIVEFNQKVYFSEVQMEYGGDLPRKNGDFIIPEVVFEYLIAFVLEKRDSRRKDVTDRQKLMNMQKVKDERKIMFTNLAGLTIDEIFQVATSLPVV